MTKKIGESKITRNGQITLSKPLRKELKIDEGDYVIFLKESRGVRLVPAEIKAKKE